VLSFVYYIWLRKQLYLNSKQIVKATAGSSRKISQEGSKHEYIH